MQERALLKAQKSPTKAGKCTKGTKKLRNVQKFHKKDTKKHRKSEKILKRHEKAQKKHEKQRGKTPLLNKVKFISATKNGSTFPGGGFFILLFFLNFFILFYSCSGKSCPNYNARVQEILR